MPSRSLIVLAVPCGFINAAPALKEKPVATSIVGEWERTAHSQIGDVVKPDMSDHRQIFSAGGEWSYSYRGKTTSPKGQTFVMNREKNPPTVDIHTQEDCPPQYLGIYKIDGDTLTMCLVLDGERPQTFETSPDGTSFLWMFKRVKAKD